MIAKILSKLSRFRVVNYSERRVSQMSHRACLRLCLGVRSVWMNEYRADAITSRVRVRVRDVSCVVIEQYCC